ncbi:MAG: hypothetical protein GX940_04605 [Clostridiaceae bacterium]|nr:hypothetical protein [Clostridiaceae bacterium]
MLMMLGIALITSLLSGILFLVLLESYISKREKAKIIISPIISALALLSMILFCYIQKINGNPDMGKEFGQWYLPISIYLFLIVTGVISFIITIIKNVRSRKAES